MTYNSGIPAASGSTLVGTRDGIRTNFTISQNRFELNHIAYGAGATTGKHLYVQMPTPQAQGTSPLTAAVEWIEFPATIAGGAVEIFWKRPNQAVNVGHIQMTSNIAPTAAQNNGQTFLPGGLIAKWGLTAASGAATQAVTFSPVFPTNLYHVQITPTRATASPGDVTGAWVSTAGLSTSGFTIAKNNSHSFAFYWLAIGN